jgi:hypothetical protein
MALTKSLIFTGISVSGVSYSPFLEDSVEVTIEPVADLVNNGQTLPSAYNLSFSATLYNTSIATGANIYTNAEVGTFSLTSVVFTGGEGGQTLNISNVLVHASLDLGNGRTAYTIGGTKKVASLAGVLTLT